MSEVLYLIELSIERMRERYGSPNLSITNHLVVARAIDLFLGVTLQDFCRSRNRSDRLPPTSHVAKLHTGRTSISIDIEILTGLKPR
jgi:hypothetical protein